MAKEPMAKLILHFDVNETIIVEDAAGGDTRAACLNKIMCKSILVDTTDDPVRLYADGLPLIGSDPVASTSHPPFCFQFEKPANTETYYRGGKALKQTVASFHEHAHGNRFTNIRESLQEALAAPGDYPAALLSKSSSTPSHFIIPSFFHTLYTLLHVQKRDVGIILRTYGDDVDEIVAAIELFASGGHPMYPDANLPGLMRIRKCVGRYSGDGEFVVREASGGERVGNSETELLEAIESEPCVAIQDDYEFWSEGGCSPACGKPVWVTEEGDGPAHIFFDDNIHNSPEDSIVAVRARKGEGEGFEAVSGAETLAYEGRNIVKCFTVPAVLEKDYFLKEIERCERNQSKHLL